MKKKIERILLVLFFSIILLCTMNIYAHSGRTDSSGGHRDNKNVSGLGSYHYHCDGNPPHLHINGICPYEPVSIPTTTNISPTIVKSINVESVTIASSVKDIEIGETMKLSTTILPNNASDKTIKWTTNNAEILVVDTNGLVTAKSAGLAIVTATSINGIVDKKEIIVKQSPKSISINKDITELTIGQTMKLTATIEPNNSVYEASWLTSNSEIATVDVSGNVKALKEGNVIITVKTNNGKSDSINIKIVPEIISSDALQIVNTSENSDNFSGIIGILILGGAGYLCYRKYKKHSIDTNEQAKRRKNKGL